MSELDAETKEGSGTIHRATTLNAIIVHKLHWRHCLATQDFV